jgi:signal peptidase
MKKKLTPKQKKIIDISITALQIAIVLVAIIISAIVIANPIVTSGKVSNSKTKLLPVLSDSMNGPYEDSFKTGDLVIAATPKDKFALEKGDIITYVGPVNGKEELITHRIVDVAYLDGKANTYFTLGDAQPRDATPVAINPHDVLAVYKYHINGVGKAINWLQDDKNFLFVIVLPLIALFIYNIIMFVRMIMQNKLEKVKEATANSAPVIDEEEIKRRAIEEFLAKQAQANNTQEAKEDNTDNNEKTE